MLLIPVFSKCFVRIIFLLVTLMCTSTLIEALQNFYFLAAPENSTNLKSFILGFAKKLESTENLEKENARTLQRLSEQSLRLSDTFEELRIKQNKMDGTLNKNAIALRMLLEPSKFGEKLQSAIKEGDLEQVVLLLELGAPIEYQNSKNDRPIHVAVEYQHPKILEVLIENRADLESHGQYNRTPLHWAGYSKCLECTRILLDKGASVKSHDNWLNTPLIAPVVGGLNEQVELLLQRGADVNAKQIQKYNGVHFACRQGHLDTLKILIKYGAELQAKTVYGETGLSLARTNDHVEIVNFLENEFSERQ